MATVAERGTLTEFPFAYRSLAASVALARGAAWDHARVSEKEFLGTMKRTLKLGLALLAAAGGGSACAMNSPKTHADPIRCSVEFAGKLPAGLSEDAVCEAIRQASAPALQRAGVPPASLSVKVRVESDTKIVATASLAGKALPEHRVAVSDRALNVSAIQMLARAIAADVASVRQ